MATVITYKNSESYHLPGVVKLADMAFGEGYLTLELACEISNFLVALDVDRVIGYAFNTVEDGVGNISHVVVDPRYRGRGIGTELVKRSVEILATYDISRVESQAWQRSDNRVVPLASALEANGFSRIKYLPNFYNLDHSEDVPCNVCGNVCTCGAWQYELQVNEQDTL